MFSLKTSESPEQKNPTSQQIDEALQKLKSGAEDFVVLENDNTGEFIQTQPQSNGFVVEVWRNGNRVDEKTVMTVEALSERFAKFHKTQKGAGEVRSQPQTLSTSVEPQNADSPFSKIKDFFSNSLFLVVVVLFVLVWSFKFWMPPLVEHFGDLDTGATYEIPAVFTPHAPGEQIRERSLHGYYCGEIVQRRSNKKLYHNLFYMKISYPDSRSCRDAHENTPVKGYFLDIPYLSSLTFGGGIFVYKDVPYFKEMLLGMMGSAQIFIVILVIWFFVMRAVLRRQKRLKTSAAVVVPPGYDTESGWQSYKKLNSASRKWKHIVLICVVLFVVGVAFLNKAPPSAILLSAGFVWVYFWFVMTIVPYLFERLPVLVVQATAKKMGMPVTVKKEYNSWSIKARPGVESRFLKLLVLRVLMFGTVISGMLAMLGLIGLLAFAASKILD